MAGWPCFVILPSRKRCHSACGGRRRSFLGSRDKTGGTIGRTFPPLVLRGRVREGAWGDVSVPSLKPKIKVHLRPAPTPNLPRSTRGGSNTVVLQLRRQHCDS